MMGGATMGDDLKFRVFLPATGKFYDFGSISKMVGHFTPNEVQSLLQQDENCDGKHVDVILSAEVVGSISFQKCYYALFNFEREPV